MGVRRHRLWIYPWLTHVLAGGSHLIFTVSVAPESGIPAAIFRE